MYSEGIDYFYCPYCNEHIDVYEFEFWDCGVGIVV